MLEWGVGSILLGDPMFTRTPSTDPRPLEPRRANGSATIAGPFSADARATPDKSVIGNDLKIVGQGLKIFGRGVLQIDGEIEGDVQGAQVIVGEKGKVTGVVAAVNVIIRGTVSGVVCGKEVALQGSSHVQGDVHHMSLAIEQGAMFEGRSRRAVNEAALIAVVEGKGAAA
jgi:cytoskeletal protein CcmA (bactofilin family)